MIVLELRVKVYTTLEMRATEDRVSEGIFLPERSDFDSWSLGLDELLIIHIVIEVSTIQ